MRGQCFLMTTLFAGASSAAVMLFSLRKLVDTQSEVIKLQTQLQEQRLDLEAKNKQANAKLEQMLVGALFFLFQTMNVRTD